MPGEQEQSAQQRQGAETHGEPSTFKNVIRILQQIFFAYAISQLIGRFLVPSTPPATSSAASKQSPSSGIITNTPETNSWLKPPTEALPSWQLNLALDMHVYLSTSPRGDVFSKGAVSSRRDEAAGLPHFVWKDITFGGWGDTRVVNYDIKFPEFVLNNGTLWADIFLTRNGANPNPHHNKFNPVDIHHVRKLLTPYMARVKNRKEKNLLSGKEEEEPEEDIPETDVIVPHWHKNVTLALISDNAKVPYANLAPPVREHIHLVQNERDETGTKGFYKPIIFPNEFWHLRSHYVEINQTTPILPLEITFQPMSFFKFQLFASMTAGFNEAAKQQGVGAASELDEIKRMLIETNPWFLGLTGLVSLLHVVFEMLAFKSDVSHWRQKKEMVGVSIRTIVTNVFVQVIVLLYLIDNNENTSWMILMGSGIGVVIEAWKITKAVDIKVVPAPAGSLLPYKLDIQDKHVLSEDEKKTQEYDRLAFRYVSYVAIPLLIAYTGYSLVYESHRGWYSFIISTLTSFVYMFGFAQLVPQLIINYKLKSVAHMPMKAMIYKTLSTVVDDLFAFCIKMPFLHRLACFRDDVVFLVFLYQRWIYRVDPKRVNEYGQVMTTDIDAAESESKKDR